MTDCILSQAVAVDAAQRALERYGVRCMVLPPVMMGSQNPGQRDLPFCIHYRYETQQAILRDIVDSLSHQGMRRLLIINGHGGNSFKQMIRDIPTPNPSRGEGRLNTLSNEPSEANQAPLPSGDWGLQSSHQRGCGPTKGSESPILSPLCSESGRSTSRRVALS